MSTPITRSRVVAEKASAMAVYTAILALAMWLGVAVGVGAAVLSWLAESRT